MDALLPMLPAPIYGIVLGRPPNNGIEQRRRPPKLTPFAAHPTVSSVVAVSVVSRAPLLSSLKAE